MNSVAYLLAGKSGRQCHARGSCVREGVLYKGKGVEEGKALFYLTGLVLGLSDNNTATSAPPTPIKAMEGLIP